MRDLVNIPDEKTPVSELCNLLQEKITALQSGQTDNKPTLDDLFELIEKKPIETVDDIYGCLSVSNVSIGILASSVEHLSIIEIRNTLLGILTVLAKPVEELKDNKPEVAKWLN